MNPPQNLEVIRHAPLAWLGLGAAQPMFWVFALPEGGPGNAAAVLAPMPLTALLGLLLGLFIKYRSQYSARSYLIVAPVLLLLLGNLVLCFTLGLVWMAHRPDLTTAAVGVATLLVISGFLYGFGMERRRLQARHDGVPDALRPLLDLERARIHPMPTPAAPLHMGKFAVLAALCLNLPLLLELAGGSRLSLMWLVFPLSGGAAAYLLGSQVGPGLARALAVLAIERHIGHRLQSARIDELRALRRSFWLSRWLAPETQAEPAAGTVTVASHRATSGRKR